jgi:hypothetical protein
MILKLVNEYTLIKSILYTLAMIKKERVEPLILLKVDY